MTARTTAEARSRRRREHRKARMALSGNAAAYTSLVEVGPHRRTVIAVNLSGTVHLNIVCVRMCVYANAGARGWGGQRERERVNFRAHTPARTSRSACEHVQARTCGAKSLVFAFGAQTRGCLPPGRAEMQCSDEYQACEPWWKPKCLRDGAQRPARDISVDPLPC